MQKLWLRISNEPLVIVAVVMAALDSYDGAPTWRGIAEAVATALIRFIVTGPRTIKEG